MEPQKRRNIIIGIVLTVQTIVTLLFLMFAFYQKAEADRQRQMAEQNAGIATRNRMMSVEERARAEKRIDSLTTELEKLKAIVKKK